MSSSSHPFTRDRLPEFLALRRAAHQKAEWLGESRQQERGAAVEASVPLSVAAQNNDDKTHGRASSPWVRAMHHFFELESTVRAKISQLRDQQRGFFQPKFLLDEEQEAMQQQQIEQNAQNIQKLLRELERMILSGMRPQEPVNDDEREVSENAKKHLSLHLSKIVREFRESQELYAVQLKRCKEKVERYRKFGSHEAHEWMEREEKTAHYLELGYMQVDIQELLVEEAKQKQLNHEIEEIMTSVTELHTMFKDLGAMVVEQGTVLDRVDFNVQQTHTGVKKGVDVLKKAQEKQSTCHVM